MWIELGILVGGLLILTIFTLMVSKAMDYFNASSKSICKFIGVMIQIAIVCICGFIFWVCVHH